MSTDPALSQAMLRGDFAGKNKIVVSVKPPGPDEKDRKLELEGVVVETAEPEPVGATHSEETCKRG